MTQPAEPNDRLAEIGAGSGLGLLVGILLGLSVAQVVGGVVGALAAVLAAFFGLAKISKPMPTSGTSNWRIASFGFACTLGVLIGMTVRAHDILSEPLKAKVDHWMEAGATRADAVAYVAFQQLGILPAGKEVQSVPKPPTDVSALFASHDPSECGSLAKRRFNGDTERLAAMRNSGKGWKSFADALADTPSTQLSRLLDAGYELVCGE